MEEVLAVTPRQLYVSPLVVNLALTLSSFKTRTCQWQTNPLWCTMLKDWLIPAVCLQEERQRGQMSLYMTNHPEFGRKGVSPWPWQTVIHGVMVLLSFIKYIVDTRKELNWQEDNMVIQEIQKKQIYQAEKNIHFHSQNWIETPKT